MNDETTTLDPVLIRRVAETEVSIAYQSLSLLLTANHDVYKWFLGSLLAINSGGMAALLNVDGLDNCAIIVIATSFYTGIMSALLVGYFGQKANASLVEPLREAIGYWMSVAHDGEHVPEAWAGISDRIQQSVKKAWPARAAGWLSAFFFTIGVLTFGYNVLGTSAADSQPVNRQHLSSNK